MHGVLALHGPLFPILISATPFFHRRSGIPGPIFSEENLPVPTGDLRHFPTEISALVSHRNTVGWQPAPGHMRPDLLHHWRLIAEADPAQQAFWRQEMLVVMRRRIPFDIGQRAEERFMDSLMAHTRIMATQEVASAQWEIAAARRLAVQERRRRRKQRKRDEMRRTQAGLRHSESQTGSDHGSSQADKARGEDAVGGSNRSQHQGQHSGSEGNSECSGGSGQRHRTPSPARTQGSGDEFDEIIDPQVKHM